MTRLKAKEISIFDIDSAEPTWQNERSRWFLIDNRYNKYSGWLIKNNVNDAREYAVLRNKDMEVMWMSGQSEQKEGSRLEAMWVELQLLDAGSRLRRGQTKKRGTVFSSDERQCKDGIDNVLDMADQVTESNANVKGE